MGTKELQEEIKRLLNKLKWSQKRLGRELYFAKHEYEDDNLELKRYEEKVKKDLTRKTTKIGVLETYLDLISQHNEFKNIGFEIPTYMSSGVLGDEMEIEMEKISKLASELIAKSDDHNT